MEIWNFRISYTRQRWIQILQRFLWVFNKTSIFSLRRENYKMNSWSFSALRAFRVRSHALTHKTFAKQRRRRWIAHSRNLISVRYGFLIRFDIWHYQYKPKVDAYELRAFFLFIFSRLARLWVSYNGRTKCNIESFSEIFALRLAFTARKYISMTIWI